MNPVKFVSEHKSLAGSNAVLKLAVVLLFIGLVVNAFISYSMSKRVRTVILPPVVDEKIELSGTKFSGSYLRLMSRYVTGAYDG
jgi:conjugal transfer pilus assembly protein TraE